ncbi:hypothetical protein HYDPIDRAFT_24614 [Hydnomerulius pinastri MD-312]|nr:hypothetical protein HYDPIDRAFT_24614 [Hydnomerulius pinastri MD-312]
MDTDSNSEHFHLATLKELLDVKTRLNSVKVERDNALKELGTRLDALSFVVFDSEEQITTLESDLLDARTQHEAIQRKSREEITGSLTTLVQAAEAKISDVIQRHNALKQKCEEEASQAMEKSRD